MKYLKIFEEFKVGSLYVMDDSDVTQIEIDGIPVKIVNREDSPGCQSVYIIIDVSEGSAQVGIQCFSKLDDAKNYISNMIKRYKNPSDGGDPIEINSFVIKKAILLPFYKLESEEDGETPPKWVKNPKSWAMDKIVSLLTPENINQIANYYISNDIFKFKELDNVKSNIKAIYQSSKDKKELDVTDHWRRFGIKSIRGVHQWKGDKDKIDLTKKFENLLRYFQK